MDHSPASRTMISTLSNPTNSFWTRSVKACCESALRTRNSALPSCAHRRRHHIRRELHKLGKQSHQLAHYILTHDLELTVLARFCARAVTTPRTHSSELALGTISTFSGTGICASGANGDAGDVFRENLYYERKRKFSELRTGRPQTKHDLRVRGAPPPLGKARVSH